jgi:signal transduction histidine kinase
VESTFSNLLFEPEVQAIVIQQRDINARRAAEAEARQRADELTRSNLRLEEFARVAAHDLREPLLSISLYTELLAHKSQMDANARQMAQIILDGAARVTALVDGLLSFANTGMHEPARSINLLRAFEQAAKNLAVPLKTSGAQITVGRLPVVESKEIQLVSLFQNLISNAVKYRREAPLEIQVAAERRGPYWVVKVADNGSGIPQRTNFGSLCPSCGWPAARRSAAVSAWRFVRRSWRNWAARSGSNPNWEQDRHSVLPLWRRAGLWLPRSAYELAQDGAQLRLCALMLA